MKRNGLIFAISALLAACLGAPAIAAAEPAPATSPGTRPGDPPPRRTFANPGGVIAAELSFARLAQEKGQWTAFRAIAAPNAEMFVPQRVLAATWLKGRRDPARTVRWQPHAVWSSCDGSIAVTHGAWQDGAAGQDGAGQDGGRHGWFTTVWERQPKGEWRWLLDHGAETPEALPAPEMIQAKVAECTGRPGVPLSAPEVGEDMKQGVSRDQTLLFASTVAPDGARRVEIRLWNGTHHDTVLTDMVTAAQAR